MSSYKITREQLKRFIEECDDDVIYWFTEAEKSLFASGTVYTMNGELWTNSYQVAFGVSALEKDKMKEIL